MATVGALYRIKTSFPNGKGKNTDEYWSGIKVGHGRKWKLRLPPWESMRIPNLHWNFFNVYMGIQYTFIWEGIEYMSAIESGLSIRGCELHQLESCPFCPGGKPSPRGWHGMYGFNPRFYDPPYNDPPVGDITLRRTALPIVPDNVFDITMELKTVRYEKILARNRWYVDLIVNDKVVEFIAQPRFWGTAQLNRYDSKIIVGGEMAGGSNPDDLSHGPVILEYLQVGRADCNEKIYHRDKIYLPLKPGHLQNGLDGIQAKTAYNTLRRLKGTPALGLGVCSKHPRDFAVVLNAEKYFWSIELPPVVG